MFRNFPAHIYGNAQVYSTDLSFHAQPQAPVHCCSSAPCRCTVFQAQKVILYQEDPLRAVHRLIHCASLLIKMQTPCFNTQVLTCFKRDASYKIPSKNSSFKVTIKAQLKCRTENFRIIKLKRGQRCLKFACQHYLMLCEIKPPNYTEIMNLIRKMQAWVLFPKDNLFPPPLPSVTQYDYEETLQLTPISKGVSKQINYTLRKLLLCIEGS